jgi:hypothetical protein
MPLAHAHKTFDDFVFCRCQGICACHPDGSGYACQGFLFRGHKAREHTRGRGPMFLKACVEGCVQRVQRIPLVQEGKLARAEIGPVKTPRFDVLDVAEVPKGLPNVYEMMVERIEIRQSGGPPWLESIE